MDANDIVLMCKRSGVMLPFYKGGLSSAHGWPHSVRSQYKNAVMIDEDGFAKEIRDLRILGPLGKTKFSKLLSVLNSDWSVELLFEERNVSYEEVLRLVILGLENDCNSRTQFFKTSGEQANSVDVRGSRSAKEIFIRLGLNREVLADKKEDVSEALDCL